MIEIQKIRTGRKSGEEKGEDLSENGERGAHLGYPHHLLRRRLPKLETGKGRKPRRSRPKEGRIIFSIGKRESRKIGRWRNRRRNPIWLQSK